MTPERLPDDVRTLLENPREDLVFSVCSIWELAIKAGLGKRDFDIDPAALRDDLLKRSTVELDVRSAHVLAVRNLPDLHQDPFDRLLLAQARTEGHRLLTADRKLHLYGDGVLPM